MILSVVVVGEKRYNAKVWRFDFAIKLFTDELRQDGLAIVLTQTEEALLPPGK